MFMNVLNDVINSLNVTLKYDRSFITLDQTQLLIVINPHFKANASQFENNRMPIAVFDLSKQQNKNRPNNRNKQQHRIIKLLSLCLQTTTYKVP